MIKINAIAWNVSNIFGLYASLDQFFDSYNDYSLTLILGPKCNVNPSSIDLYYQLFERFEFSFLKIYSLPRKVSLFYAAFPLFFSKINFFPSVFFFTSPANPPITLFTPWVQTYYYGDGLGTKPEINYQWQPNLSHSSLQTIVRYLFTNLSFKLASKINKSVDVSLRELDPGIYLASLVRAFKFCYLGQVSFFFKVNKISRFSRVHVLVLSLLSPIRTSFTNEVKLYSDFINRRISSSTSSECFLVKFHYHHDRLFRDAFLIELKKNISSSFSVMEFTPILPAEALIVFLQHHIFSTSVSLYVFQQSFVLISAIKDFLHLKNVSLFFGFDDDLIEKYFYSDEAIKRLEYQRNMSENTVFPS